MQQVDALSGTDGMIALLRAFIHAGSRFDIDVKVATPVVGPGGRHLLFTIGETSAALTIAQTQWLGDNLVGQMRDIDLQNFGRFMLRVLADTPGVYGAH